MNRARGRCRAPQDPRQEEEKDKESTVREVSKHFIELRQCLYSYKFYIMSSNQFLLCNTFWGGGGVMHPILLVSPAFLPEYTMPKLKGLLNYHLYSINHAFHK